MKKTSQSKSRSMTAAAISYGMFSVAFLSAPGSALATLNQDLEDRGEKVIRLTEPEAWSSISNTTSSPNRSQSSSAIDA